MSRLLAAGLAVVAVVLFQTEARAASPTERLRGFFTSAARALEDPRTEISPEDRLSTIRALVRDIFDFREAAQLSLGPEWGVRTPAERTEFVGLFADLLERSFIAGIAARIRLADGVQVSFIDESVHGPLATVRTAIAAKSGLELPFHYRMIERGQHWAVRDVVVDGVSLAANYRAQFGRIMQISSYAELIRQLRARVSGTAMIPVVAVAEAGSVPTLVSPMPPAIDLPRPASTDPPPAQLAQAMATDAQARELAFARPSPAPAPRPAPVALAQPEPVTALAEGSSREPVAAAPEVREARLLPETTRPPIRVASPRLSRPKSYWVQVGAFINVAAAKRLASALEEQEPAAPPNRWVVVIEPAETGVALARVRVGPFAARAEAASKLRDVQTRGYKPFIAEERD